MKQLSIPAIILAGSLFVMGCNSKNKEKIEELEQKIAQMEESGTPSPANAENVRAADAASLGMFDFEQTEYDFGTIPQGKVIDYEFTFTNTGKAPLVISNIQASCGCTTPDWTKEPVKPGEKGNVKVSFNSAGKSGAQSPTVRITANTSPSITRLVLKGTVETNKTNSASAMGPIKK